MVDSAVTLSIGTELDLSGLQKDLAALKNQKFNFDFDADKIGRSFREANRQMRLTPTVDLAGLHELNKLLDVKLSHFKKVQKYFDANPLKIKTTKQSADLVKELQSLKSGEIVVKGSGKSSAQNYLQAISRDISTVSKNTKGKGGILGTVRTGFLEGIGATSAKRLSTGVTKVFEDKLNSSIERLGEAIGTGLLNIGKTLGRSSVKGVLGVDPADFAQSFQAFFSEIEGFIDFGKVQETSDNLENSFAKLLGTIAAVDQGFAGIPKDLEALGKAALDLKRPFLEAIKARRDSKMGAAAKLTKDVAMQESVPLDPSKQKLVIVSGGFAGKGGESGRGLTEVIEKLVGDAAQFESVANTFTDTLNSSNEGVIRWSAQAAQKLLDMTVAKGYNPDAVVMAAKAVSARQENPEMPIDLVGYSAGGYVVQQAMQILKKLGITNVRGTALGTPTQLGQGQGGLSESEFQAFLGLEDGLQAFVQAAELFHITAKEGAETAQTVVGHNIEAYLADPQVQERLTGRVDPSASDRTAFDLVRIKKDAASLAMESFEGIQGMSESMGSPVMMKSFQAYLSNMLDALNQVSESLQKVESETPLDQVRGEATDLLNAMVAIKSLVTEVLGGEAIADFAENEIQKIEQTIESLVDQGQRQKEKKLAQKKQGSYRISAEQAAMDSGKKTGVMAGAGNNLLTQGLEELDGVANSLVDTFRALSEIPSSQLTESLTVLNQLFNDLKDNVSLLNEVITNQSIPLQDSPEALDLSQFAAELEPVLVEIQTAIQEPLEAFVGSTEDMTEPIAEIAPIVEELSVNLEELRENLNRANAAILEVSETALTSFTATAAELKSFMLDPKNLVMSAKKKGQPDLRAVGKTLGVPTKNEMTGKAFTKEELVDYLVGNFDPKVIQEAIAKVKEGLYQANPEMIADLGSQYEKLQAAINSIDLSPIEEQERLWEELEAALLRVAGMMEHVQKVFSFDQKTSQQFQGRKQAFQQQYILAKKAQADAKKRGHEIGEDVVAGIAQGITDQKNMADQAIQMVAESLPEIAKDELEIKSPSRVFARIGKNIIEGIEAGLNSSDLAREMIGALLGIENATEQTGKEIISRFADNIKSPEITAAFGKLKESAVSAFAQIFKGVDGGGGLSTAIQGITGKATAAILSFTNAAISALPNIVKAAQDTVLGALGAIDGFFSNLQGNILKFAGFLAQAFVLTKIVQGAVALGKASFQTALQVEQLTRSLSFSTADGGVATLEKIRQKANELNVSFIEAAKGYSQLAASTLGTSLEGQTDSIFEGVATAVSARGLSGENQSRAFLAISQIASKGRVSLEELNGQLGEALPGALQTAARALGVTSQELIKMVETGQVTADDFLPKFAAQLSLEAGSSVAAAAGSATAQLTKFDNQLTQIRANIGQGILDALTLVLPVVNGALAFAAENTAAFSTAATVLASVLAINLGKAILTVASQLKIVNLLMSLFGLSIAPATALATKKATFAINGLGFSLKGAGMAMKGLLVQALPLLAIASVFNGIRTALTPLNEDLAKTAKGFRQIADEAEKNKPKDKKQPLSGFSLGGVVTGAKALSSPLSITSLQGQGEILRGIAQGVTGDLEKVPRPILQATTALDKLLQGMSFGLFGRSGDSIDTEQFLQLSEVARDAAKAVEAVQASFVPLSEEAKTQLQGIDDEAKKLRVEINVGSSQGLDTSALKQQLDDLQTQRRDLLSTVEGYDEAVAASQELENAIGNLNKQYEDNQISTADYNSELGVLQGLQVKNQALLDGYAESTNTITTNVRKLAFEIRSVGNELDKARADAERTASQAQTALIKGRLSGAVSAIDFGAQQSAITKQQTQAISDATQSAQSKAFDAIQMLDKSVVDQLNIAFGGAGFTGGLGDVLANATTQSIEQAKNAFMTKGGDLDPTGEVALSAIQQYIELRDQSINLEKELAQLELDRRQQTADLLQQGIDLENTRAQAANEAKNIQAQIGITAKQAAGGLSEFDLQLANFANQAKQARDEAARLTASATDNRGAAEDPNLLPEAKEQFLRTATREALEAQLKEQEAVLAETQARIATALRPIELGTQAAQVREQELQVSNAIRENLASSSKALSDFDRQIIGFGNSISQLIEEATNLESIAATKRTAAGTAGLAPDEQKRLLREAKADDLLASQKRSEAELRKVEADRVTKIRQFELATKQATVANETFYQSRKIGILTEQSNAKTVDEIATAGIIAQKKQLMLETEYTQEKLKLNQQEIQGQKTLFNQGAIDADTYNNRINELTQAGLQLQEEATNQRIQLNQREIEDYNTLRDQLKSIDQIRTQVVEAQLKGQERLSQSTAVYTDALSKQAELTQSIAKIQQMGGRLSIQQSEQAIAALNEQKGVIESLNGSGLFTDGDPKKLEAYRKQVESLAKSFGVVDTAKLAEMDQGQLSGLKATLEKAKGLGVSKADLGDSGLLAIEEKIQEKTLAIAKEKALLLQQEQATQRELLALEIERNKIAAQTAIRESEIAALRAKNAIVTAQVEVKRASTPEEMIQAQLGLQLAQEEFQFALSQIDISKQGAVIGDRLSQFQKEGLLGEQGLERNAQSGEFGLQFAGQANPFDFGGGGVGFKLDADVQKLASMGDSLKGITDFSKYDALLAQLDNAAAPLENQIETQQRAIQASDRLATGIESLNAKIERLVTTLGRPNISVGGGSSVTEAINIMRASK